MYTCIDKTMQIVLERGSIDTSYYTYACKSVFNPNIPIFPPNSAEGLHFSAFYYYTQEEKFESKYYYIIIYFLLYIK